MGRSKNLIDIWIDINERNEREARKEARMAERQAKLEEKQRLLEEKIETIKCFFDNIDINQSYPRIKYPFESLRKTSITHLNTVHDLIHELEDDDLIKIIRYLSNGQRVEAIRHLIENTDYSYNKIIQTVSSIENDISYFLKHNEEARQGTGLGEYEFEPIENIFDIQKDTDDYTANTSVTIECTPINCEEYISGKNPDVVKNKVLKVLEKFYNKWNKAFSEYHLKRENNIVTNIRQEFNNILNYSINNPIEPFDFKTQFDTTVFSSELLVIQKPQSTPHDINYYENTYQELQNTPPKIEDISLNFFSKLLSKTFLKFLVNYWKNKKLKKITSKWSNDCSVAKQNLENKKQENIAINEEHRVYQEYLKQLETEKTNFLKKQEKYNQSIQEKINNFQKHNTTEIIEFFKNTLEMSIYPFLKGKNMDISYNPTDKTIIIDYEIPTIEDIYDVEKVTYVSTQKEFKAVKIKSRELNSFYNNTIYQICIRTLREIFYIDTEYNFVESAIFNGMAVCNNKSTGKRQTVCICSIQANKREFNEINLSNIVPEYCFKMLKGVGAAELNSIIPIAPIRNIDKTDKRFIEAYDVLSTIKTGTNLAAIDWKDFENLIREVFEKEFSGPDEEVKITQSSKDGGVDVIAFDPDPIKGGKIVIQAKRYTNVVGVSAVRDLYGTLMNEGANKGILVTTSHFGSDAYDFAKGKPIKLLNGQELLGMMKAHGYDCYINLQEAKEILREENKQTSTK